MICVCAYCKTITGVKEPLEDTSITHGICPDCKRRELAALASIAPPDSRPPERSL